MEVMSWTGSRNNKFCSLRIKIEEAHTIQSLSYEQTALETLPWFLAHGIDVNLYI